MRNVSHILEKKLTDYLVTDQARFYRMAYSYLKNREEALDAGSYEDPLPSDGTLAQRVDALPPEVGTIIKLRFYEDLSLKEISTVTGWNLNTVKTRLYTGLKKLRISMEGDQL